ncbi:MAG: MoaD/ThiS family protein [Ignavibacteriales bacterium]
MCWYAKDRQREQGMEPGEGRSVENMLTAMGIPLNEVQCVTINGRMSDLSLVPADGDVVEVIPVVTGG